MTTERIDKVSTYKGDIITQSINLGSAWVSKDVGIRLIHIPTRIMAECTSSDREHANRFKAVKMLDEALGKLNKVPFPVDNPDISNYIGVEIATGKTVGVDYDPGAPYIIKRNLFPERYHVIRQTLKPDMSVIEEIVTTCGSIRAVEVVKDSLVQKMKEAVKG